MQVYNVQQELCHYALKLPMAGVELYLLYSCASPFQLSVQFPLHYIASTPHQAPMHPPVKYL